MTTSNAAPIVKHDAAANVRWNFSVNLLDVSFIVLGLSLISRETVMPLLVSTLTDSKLALGLIPALWGLGIYLPQLFTANYAEGLVYKKPFLMLLSSVGERLPYLLIGIAVFMFAVPAPTLTLFLFFLFLTTAALCAGAGAPAWYDMIAKVIPVERRGIWAGLGSGIGALMGIVGAYFVGRILDTFIYPNNFAVLFLLAFVAVMISWVGLALNREPPSEIVKHPLSLRRYFGQLPSIFKTNHNYRRFFISRSIVQFGTMASGFFIVYASERFALDGADIGALTASLVASQALMGPIWGMLGDRIGHKFVLVSAAFALTLATFSAWFAPTQAWLYVTFFLLGAYYAADWVSSLNIILEFCAPEDRPTYIGLTNTLFAPTIVLAPLIGGWIATVTGYSQLMLIATVIAAAGGVLLAVWVHEPRQQVSDKVTG